MLAHHAAHPAAQGQPRDTRIGRRTQRGDQPDRLHLPIELTEKHTPLCSTHAALDVDSDIFHG